MNTVELEVIDVSSGQPLQGATISVNGAAATQSGSDGMAYFNAGADDNISVSFVGYDTYSMPAGLIEETGQVQLSRKSDTLPAVLVTPNTNKSLSPAAGLIGLAIIGGLAVASTSKDRMSGLSKKQTTTIAVGALALGAVYFMTKKQVAPAGTPGSFVAPRAPTQPILNPAAGSSILSQGSSILSSIAKLFGGGSSQPSGPTFAPVGIDTSTYETNEPLSPAADYPTIDPSSGMTLDFSSAPGMSGLPNCYYDGCQILGDISADTFSAADIVGKSLVANKNILTYDTPYDGAQPIGTIPAGQVVGVVYSWLDADPSQGRSGIWWMFQDSNGNYFYVPHAVGSFNISSLVQQGVQTQQQKDLSTLPAWQQTLYKIAPWIIGGVVVVGLGREVIKKHL